MIRFLATLALVVGTLLLAACTSQQSRYVPLAQSYEPLPSDFSVEVFRFGLPEKPKSKGLGRDHVGRLHSCRRVAIGKQPMNSVPH